MFLQQKNNIKNLTTISCETSWFHIFYMSRASHMECESREQDKYLLETNEVDYTNAAIRRLHIHYSIHINRSGETANWSRMHRSNFGNIRFLSGNSLIHNRCFFPNRVYSLHKECQYKCYRRNPSGNEKGVINSF